jgi:hypothetical protein
MALSRYNESYCFDHCTIFQQAIGKPEPQVWTGPDGKESPHVKRAKKRWHLILAREKGEAVISGWYLFPSLPCVSHDLFLIVVPYKRVILFCGHGKTKLLYFWFIAMPAIPKASFFWISLNTVV